MSTPVRIPADIERPDRVLGSLTARQVAILTVTGLLLYAAWNTTRTVVPLPLFAILATPPAAVAVILALGQRDGISLDRLALAALHHRLTPRHRLAAPDGVHPAPAWLTHQATTDPLPGTHGTRPAPLHLPATGVHAGTGGGHEVGILDLGPDGLALIAAAGTVNFALRTPAEQDALVAGFGRYLHSLNAPVQLLVRTERLDLTGQISDLRERAGTLAHPALETAALEHADYLAQLAAQADLLRRQVLLLFREPRRPAASASPTTSDSPFAVSWMSWRHRSRDRDHTDAAARRAAESRLARRLADAVELLAPAGIVVTGLDAAQATAVLAAACNPDTLLPPSAALAAPDEIITTPAPAEPDRYPDHPGHGGDLGEHWPQDWSQDMLEHGTEDWSQGWADDRDGAGAGGRRGWAP